MPTHTLNPSQPWKQKWGDDFFSSRGYVQVPCALLEFARPLGLSPQDIAVLTATLYWKWDNREPFPSIKHIAEAIGRKPRAVQRILHSLEARKLIIIHHQRTRTDGRQTTNSIDFRPLRHAINKLKRLGLPAWALNRFSAQQPLIDPDDQEV